MHIRLPVAAAVAFFMGAIVGVQAAGAFTVVQRALVFDKASVSRAKGDRITFTNEDDIHNIQVFEPSDDQKDLGLQKPGATLSYIFDKAGAYVVRCDIHPSVKVAVTVK